MREFEEAGLRGALRYLDLQVVARLAEIDFDPPSHGTKPANKRCEGAENYKIRNVGSRDQERMEGFGEEIIKTHRGEDQGHRRTQRPSIPGGNCDCKQQNRDLDVADLEALEEERQGQRASDGENRDRAALEGR